MMMSKEKYQEALNTLFMMSSEHLGFELNYEKNLLQELVDKEKEEKPFDFGTGSYKLCPNCTVFLKKVIHPVEGKINPKYCPHCDQKIDWTKNEQTNSSD